MDHTDLITQTRSLLDSILAHQSDEGDFIGSDVHTFHFAEALRSVSSIAFEPYINHAMEWFEKLEDPRDANPRSVSPFRLLALACGNRSEEYVSVALGKMTTTMCGNDGNINLPLGFVEASDVYDMFPTLVGVTIIMEAGLSEYQPLGEKALGWCCSRLTNSSRLGNVGFLALKLVEAANAGWSIDNSALDSCVGLLEAGFEADSSSVDPLQLAYLAYDCVQISRSRPDLIPASLGEKFVARLHEWQNNDEEGFYKNQDRALLDLRAIIAYASAMSTDEKERFVEILLGSAFGDKVSISRRFRQLQVEAHQLYAELKRREMEERREGLFIQPLWDINVSRVDPSLVFFLMPFSNDSSASHIKAINRIFQDVLRVAIEGELPFSVRRADDIFDIRPIMQSVWDSLLEARVIVADLTDRNPNVFYEAGLADALGKDLILMAQNEDDIPFDLRHRRVIIYDVAYPGPEKLRTALITTLRNVIEEPNKAIDSDKK